MKRYLLNSLVAPVNYDDEKKSVFVFERIEKEEACSLVKNSISAIGHPSTARLIGILCKTHVPSARPTVFFEKGDEGIHFFPKQRLPEGKVIDREEELEKIGYWWVRSRRIE